MPDTIAMRAVQQIRRRAKAQNSPVPALLRRIGVSRELFWRWKQNKNDISACYLQQMALDGYDVVYILTGKRQEGDRNAKTMGKQIRV